MRRRVALQRRLIGRAVECLNPGGVLVYCVCSLEPEENEAVINAVHRAAPGAAIAFNTRPDDSAAAAARWLQVEAGR